MRKSSRSLGRGLTVSGLASKKIPNPQNLLRERQPHKILLPFTTLLSSFSSSIDCVSLAYRHLCFLIDREPHRTRIGVGFTSCIPTLSVFSSTPHTSPITFSPPRHKPFLSLPTHQAQNHALRRHHGRCTLKSRYSEERESKIRQGARRADEQADHLQDCGRDKRCCRQHRYFYQWGH